LASAELVLDKAALSHTHQSRAHQAQTHQATPTTARTVLDPDSLPKFVDPLPIPPTAQAAGYRPSPMNPGVKVPYYKIAMRQFEKRVHRDLKPTLLWGYESAWPGPTFETRSGEELLVEWANELPEKHFLPIDHDLHGAHVGTPEVRTVVHLHGARVPPGDDGHPENWYVRGNSAAYHYPNRQDAMMLWYHDHAMGIHRLNMFAGLLGLFVIRNSVEEALNLPKGRYEVPLVLCDRIFDQQGRLNYPVSDNAEAPWLPEVFGNATTVNGTLFPYLDVEPRKYRFRVLNASNSRFHHLSFSTRLSFLQIGSDQGLLPEPVQLTNLFIAPAERMDVIVDFTNHSGQEILLKDETSAVMQVRVSSAVTTDISSSPMTLRPVPRIQESQAVKTRVLTLNEYQDLSGNPVLMLLNGARWHEPITENPVINTAEIWSLVNLTDDSHPIHLHLVRFQILDRRPFDRFAYRASRVLRYTGPAVSPDPGEAGWKDTVKAAPAMVTRIIIPFEGYTGRYVWHCHILEHADNEMMRPYEVIAAS
jgi:spore coat protein A, manganese oxidase